jgi:hypothetical protein
MVGFMRLGAAGGSVAGQLGSEPAIIFEDCVARSDSWHDRLTHVAGRWFFSIVLLDGPWVKILRQFGSRCRECP